MTMYRHVHDTLEQRTRCTRRCTMQIGCLVVCDTAKSDLNNKPLLVVEYAFPLTGSVGLMANTTTLTTPCVRSLITTSFDANTFSLQCETNEIGT